MIGIFAFLQEFGIAWLDAFGMTPYVLCSFINCAKIHVFIWIYENDDGLNMSWALLKLHASINQSLLILNRVDVTFLSFMSICFRVWWFIIFGKDLLHAISTTHIKKCVHCVLFCSDSALTNFVDILQEYSTGRRIQVNKPHPLRFVTSK